MPDIGSKGVLVRVKAVAANPADVKWRSGMFQAMVPLQLPPILGYDIAGTVESVVQDCGEFVPGTRVLAMLDPIIKGGYAAFVSVPADKLSIIPDKLDFTHAAAIPTAALAGFQMIDEHVKPVSGETVLVTGAVGRCAPFAAQRRGARTIAAVRSKHMQEARDLGAANVIELEAAVLADSQFDQVADTVGGAAVARLCRSMRPGGRICTVATTPIDRTGLASDPVFLAVQADPQALDEIAQIVASGKLTIPVAVRLPLAAAADAHRLVEAGGTGGKIVPEL